MFVGSWMGWIHSSLAVVDLRFAWGNLGGLEGIAMSLERYEIESETVFMKSLAGSVPVERRERRGEYVLELGVCRNPSSPQNQFLPL